MPDTGPPYHLPFPDGDMPPDGPSQLGDLAQVTSEKLREVENKASHELSAFVQRYQQEHDAQNQAIWNTAVSAGGNATKKDLADLEKKLTLLSPFVITKDIRNWSGGTYRAGQYIKYEFTNITSQYGPSGNVVPITNIAGVMPAWVEFNDIHVDNFDVWVDYIYPARNAFVIKIKCNEAATVGGTNLGKIGVLIVPDNQTVIAVATSREAGST